jgi:hypothetical protein
VTARSASTYAIRTSVVGEQVLPAEHRILRGRGAVELVGLEVPRLERVVRLALEARGVEHVARHDRRRDVPVVEQRGVGGEALDPHQLLGVEAAVRLAELRVPLARDLTDLAVVRHFASRFVPFTGRASDNRTLLSVPWRP